MGVAEEGGSVQQRCRGSRRCPSRAGLLRAPLASSHRLAFPAVPALGKPRGEQQTGGGIWNGCPSTPCPTTGAAARGFALGAAWPAAPLHPSFPANLGLPQGVSEALCWGRSRGWSLCRGTRDQAAAWPGVMGVPHSCGAGWGQASPCFEARHGQEWAGRVLGVSLGHILARLSAVVSVRLTWDTGNRRGLGVLQWQPGCPV